MILSNLNKRLGHLYPQREYSVIGKYQGARKGIKIRHNKCCHVWSPRPNNFLNGNGCPKCAKKRANKEKSHDTKWFKQQVHQLYPHHEYSVVTPYVNKRTKILIRHNKCKYHNTWKILPLNFLNGHGCPKCSLKRQGHNHRRSAAWFAKQIDRMYPDHRYTLLTPYKKAQDKIQVKCNQCNNPWWTRPYCLLLGEGCPHCASSHGEHLVGLWLKRHKLNYIHGYKLNIFKDHSKCPHLDFMLKDYRIGIEFDGVQHFKPVKHFGGKSKFKSRHENDRNKDLYCNLLGIRLIRVENPNDVRVYKKLRRLVFKSLDHQLLPILMKIKKSGSN